MKIRTFFIAGAALVFGLSAAAELQAPGLAGVASVIDGDTIEIHSEPIRLNGIDAPESGSRCGDVNVNQAGSLALADFIGSQTVECSLTGKDNYGRHVATCTSNGQGLADFMVSQGWARDWPRYSKRAYATAELAAREAGVGIWGLECPANLWGNRNYE